MGPQGFCVVVRFNVELPAQFIGVAGAGDIDVLAAEIHLCDGEIAKRFRQFSVGTGRRQNIHRGWSLDL